MTKKVAAERVAVRCVLWGGNANNGTNDGFAYANSNNAPSNANTNVGSRISYTVKVKTSSRNPAPWQKTTYIHKVLVGAKAVERSECV